MSERGGGADARPDGTEARPDGARPDGAEAIRIEGLRKSFGANEVLKKPFANDELLGLVNKCLTTPT